MCIFCKIIENKITAYKLYEDNDIICILDMFPIEKGHTLIISKKHYENILQVENDVLAKSTIIVKKIYKKIKLELQCDGFNFTTNCNKVAGQEIFHFHWHIIPRYLNNPKGFKSKRIELSHEDFIKLKKKLKLN